MAEKYTSKELQEWLFEKALAAKNDKTARKMVLSMDQSGRSTTMIGKIYFFKYQPLYRDKLPKYDRFPMAIPIQRYNNGFLGLNLHYIGVGGRAALIDELMAFKSNSKMDDSTRMLVNWDLIKGFSRIISLAEPCVHRYIFNQCRSKFIEIYPSEYDKAIQLPVADWVFNQ